MDLLSTPLRSFLEVARSGSVTRAAAALGLTQPAVTKQIRALEAALGSPLLEREGRGVRLTEAGRLLADAGRRGAALFEGCAEELSELARGERGKLSIGAGVTTCVQLLPAWLREFRRRHPGIEVSVRTGTSRAVEDWVAHGEVDLGFITSEPRRDELLTRRLFEEEIVLVVEPAAARSGPVALGTLGLILFPKSTGFRQYLDQRLGTQSESLAVKMETDSVEAIKSFVAVGLGASFLPITTVANELREGTLARIEPKGVGPLRRRTAAVWRGSNRVSFAVRALLDVLPASPASPSAPPPTRAKSAKPVSGRGRARRR